MGKGSRNRTKDFKKFRDEYDNIVWPGDILIEACDSRCNGCELWIDGECVYRKEHPTEHNFHVIKKRCIKYNQWKTDE
jgi:hypothetical protein